MVPRQPSRYNLIRIKSNRVKKLISIGCGSGVDKNFMTSLASTPADYHHASNPGQILAVFQQVAALLHKHQLFVQRRRATTAEQNK